jgi:hypothetical protein
MEESDQKISFAASDCAVFKRYPNTASWPANVDPNDQEIFKTIWKKLKFLAEKLATNTDNPIALKPSTSLYAPNGRTPREIWCCVYSTSISNKSYGLQIAIIISERGAEVSFCQGSGTSQISDTAKKRELEANFDSMRKSLGNIAKQTIESIENSLKKKLYYRKSWLTQINETEFSSLSEWIDYASSSEGNAASVSVYFDPVELEILGEGIYKEFAYMLETFSPILKAVYSKSVVKLDHEKSFELLAEAINSFGLVSDLDLARRLFHSLTAKPFTILTGASGTGKTRLAESLAKYLACGDKKRYAVVAVGADWTDNRHVLGFVNHLRDIDGLPLFQSTPVLDMLLRSDDESEVPHFLVLDEMNLSHVERYFADFLSAMERPDGSLSLHSAGGDDDAKLPRFAGDSLGVPQSLPFPKNLFVIGTVNVDETTYMFSPKVLDRANVIEFRMSVTDLGNFLRGDGSYTETEPATEEQAAVFLETAKNKELDPLPVMNVVGSLLTEIFALMENARFEFGYRSTGEVIRYLKICRSLASDKDAWNEAGWLQDFDHQILQKLMPRLHGGKARMVPLLTELGYLCHGTEKPTGARLDSLESLQGTAKFPRSFEKIRAMAKVLIEEQFVSFIC